VRLHEHDPSLRGARRQADTAGFQAADRQHRPMVERSIAWLTRGNRKLRYRGVANNDVWLHHRIAALNLRRLLALGLTPTGSGCWPELNAGIEDRLTAQHRERDISPTDRTHLVVAYADPTGPQRRALS
jgi:Transposase DDE domain